MACWEPDTAGTQAASHGPCGSHPGAGGRVGRGLAQRGLPEPCRRRRSSPSAFPPQTPSRRCLTPGSPVLGVFSVFSLFFFTFIAVKLRTT